MLALQASEDGKRDCPCVMKSRVGVELPGSSVETRAPEQLLYAGKWENCRLGASFTTSQSTSLNDDKPFGLWEVYA